MRRSFVASVLASLFPRPDHLPTRPTFGRPGGHVRFVSLAVVTTSFACSLDPVGVNPGTGGSSSASTTASTGDASSTSGGASTGTGEGGGSTSSTGGGAAGSTGGAGGDGGAAGTGGSGAGGSGAGGSGAGGSGGSGAGGSGGAGGGGGDPGELLVRVHGPGNQVVLDVAYDPTGEFVYAVGVVDGNDVFVDDVDEHDADGRDGFVMKIARSGEVLWFTAFGGSGDDEAKSVVVADDGAVFIAGAANDFNDELDLFANDFTPAPTVSPFGWMAQVDPTTGALGVGVTFGPVTFAEPVDVTVTSTRAIAVGTCNSCTGGNARDVVLAGIDLATGITATRLIVAAGDQLGRAVAAHPLEDGFAIVGEKVAGSFDAALGAAAPCPIVSNASADVFAAYYSWDTLNMDDYDCRWGAALSSSGNDEVADVHVDAAGNVYAAAFFADDFDTPPAPGPYVAKLAATTGLMLWAQPMGTTTHRVRALGGDGSTLVVGGTFTNGYAVDLNATTGIDGNYRQVTGTSEIRGVDASAGERSAGGSWTGTSNFGADLGDRVAEGRDGFVMVYPAP